MAETQKDPEYKPTRAEQALLIVLLNPENLLKPVTEICELAKISRKQYYRIFEKPEFRDFQKKLAKELTSKYVLPTLHAFAKEATKGSYQHGKAILEMNGIVVEKKGGLFDIDNQDGGSLTIIIGGKKIEAGSDVGGGK